jgi:hypothetical protein
MVRSKVVIFISSCFVKMYILKSGPNLTALCYQHVNFGKLRVGNPEQKSSTNILLLVIYTKSEKAEIYPGNTLHPAPD